MGKSCIPNQCSHFLVGTVVLRFTPQCSCAQAWQTLQSPSVELRGGDFDWVNWAGLPPTALAEQRAATAALLEAPESPIRQLLHGLQKLVTAPQHNSKGHATENHRCAVCNCESSLGTTRLMQVLPGSPCSGSIDWWCIESSYHALQ